MRLTTIEAQFHHHCTCSQGQPCNIQYFKFLNGNGTSINGDLTEITRGDKKRNYLFLITIEEDPSSKLAETRLEEAYGILGQILSSGMDEKHLYFKCKQGPILFLVYKANMEKLKDINRSIQKQFAKRVDSNDIVLDLKFEAL